MILGKRGERTRRAMTARRLLLDALDVNGHGRRFRGLFNQAIDAGILPKDPAVVTRKQKMRLVMETLGGLSPAKSKRKPETYSERSKKFYRSRAWQNLRYRVLQNSDGCCMCCGRGREHGVILHVDHIKPRYHHPELELEISNLQVLCEDCNLGKGARDETDWRAKGLRVVK